MGNNIYIIIVSTISLLMMLMVFYGINFKKTKNQLKNFQEFLDDACNVLTMQLDKNHLITKKEIFENTINNSTKKQIIDRLSAEYLQADDIFIFTWLVMVIYPKSLNRKVKKLAKLVDNKLTSFDFLANKPSRKTKFAIRELRTNFKKLNSNPINQTAINQVKNAMKDEKNASYHILKELSDLWFSHLKTKEITCNKVRAYSLIFKYQPDIEYFLRAFN